MYNHIHLQTDVKLLYNVEFFLTNGWKSSLAVDQMKLFHV